MTDAQMTEAQTWAERTDALLLARDPFLMPAEAPRLRQLRYLHTDEAVTAADLQFTLSLYRRLANNLDIVRKQGARALLESQDRADRPEHGGRHRVPLTRLEASPWFIRLVGLLALVYTVVVVVVIAHAH